jgi:type II secretory pathway component GspD/PulD (secretin)
MKMVRVSLEISVTAIILMLLPLRSTQAQQTQTSSGERVVVCMIELEHADAEHLASVLKPFLSPQGSLSAYTPTNTLIIKDRISIVNMLAEIIKGKPCHTDCAGTAK